VNINEVFIALESMEEGKSGKTYSKYLQINIKKQDNRYGR